MKKINLKKKKKIILLIKIIYLGNNDQKGDNKPSNG